ncbi:unnamed protein product [Candidula unifasciata]|uniref:Uncharacterized protein n=1 Tax=Candidula unifasciata TaxID=100452 RepID=A0A8S3ZC79_9EUPU|nr:unnamed protein product [Candidula unifasciata]
MGLLQRLFLFKIFKTRKRNTRLITLLFGCAFFVGLHYILKWEAADSQAFFHNLDIKIPKNFVPVGIRERETFPSEGVPLIPKIIHQTWKDIHIPPEFEVWIKSWLEKHPDWEYWLWTDESARELIKDKYSHLLDMFDGYTEPIRRADALRYIVLYEYGGVYVDMDMEALSSLNPLILKYSCFIGQEPYEHPVIDTNFEQLLINALIGCRKGHPFIKLLVDNLLSFSIMWHYLDSTGPHFVTMIYRQFQSQNLLPADHKDGVYVAPSEYFYPTIDPAKLHYMFTRCSKESRLTKLQVKACINLKFKSVKENNYDPLSIAFANHHWFHTYLKNMLPSRRYKSIFDIVSRVKIYE